jgi:SAM-dependent methyltransferase
VPGDSTLKLLPEIKGKQCLEIGCGAAQNSIYLAKQGAFCTALDISKTQLAHAEKLCRQENVKIELLDCPMEENPLNQSGKIFDLIHSGYAISFAKNPAEVIKQCVEILKPGGTILFSAGHPMFSGEWLDIGDGEKGQLLKDYYSPVPDLRFDKQGNELVRSCFYPVGEMSDWFLEAGLTIEKILEPRPLPVDKMSEKDIQEKVPYYSRGWLSLYEQLQHIPVIIIFKCRKN